MVEHKGLSLRSDDQGYLFRACSSPLIIGLYVQTLDAKQQDMLRHQNSDWISGAQGMGWTYVQPDSGIASPTNLRSVPVSAS